MLTLGPSQMPPFYAVLDRIYSYLDPETGIFGVVDFYVSGKTPPGKQTAMIGGDVRRECGPLSRWFWRQWFSLDHVELHPARRDYLEYKFGTIKCVGERVNAVFGGAADQLFLPGASTAATTSSSPSSSAFPSMSGSAAPVTVTRPRRCKPSRSRPATVSS